MVTFRLSSNLGLPQRIACFNPDSLRSMPSCEIGLNSRVPRVQISAAGLEGLMWWWLGSRSRLCGGGRPGAVAECLCPIAPRGRAEAELGEAGLRSLPSTLFIATFTCFTE